MNAAVRRFRVETRFIADCRGGRGNICGLGGEEGDAKSGCGEVKQGLSSERPGHRDETVRSRRRMEHMEMDEVNASVEDGRKLGW